jgi:hypothetical protein
MKLFTSVLIALTLTACGADDQLTDSQKESAVSIPETAEGVPDFRGWQIMNGATETCFNVDRDQLHCKLEFVAGEKNCSTATVKFIVKKDGYMYISTLENVFIRQGEPHSLEFKSEPEIHNIQDQFADEKYHVLRCFGQNGEVVKL